MSVVKYVMSFLFVSSNAFSLTSEWVNNGNGNWSTASPTFWSAGVPNGVDNVAQFLGAITASRTISLSQATTVGGLSFNNNNVYIIDANTLTFQTSIGNAQMSISGGGGNHVISSSVSLVNDLVIDHNVASNVSFSGSISGQGALRVTGNNGQIFLSGIVPNTYTGLTTINTTTPSAGITLKKSPGVVAIAGDTLISSGTLMTKAANQFGNHSTVTMNGAGATFSIGAFNQIIGHLDYQQGVFQATTGTITLTSHHTALTLGNNVALNVDLALTGAGSIVMSPFAGSTATLGGL